MPNEYDALSNVHFIRLKLMNTSGAPLSTSFYWRSNAVWKYDDLQGIERFAGFLT